jgi:hypothetical protein
MLPYHRSKATRPIDHELKPLKVSKNKPFPEPNLITMMNHHTIKKKKRGETAKNIQNN